MLGKKFRIFCQDHPDQVCGLIRFILQDNEVVIIVELGDDKNQIFRFVVNIDDFQKLEKSLKEKKVVWVESRENFLFFMAQDNDFYFGYHIPGKGTMGWRLLEELH